MSPKEKAEKLDKITGDIINLKYTLADERRSNKVLPVIGEGDSNSKIMFIGEAPGKNEAIQGRPFCGASGKFLDLLLDSIGLKRNSVYITNLVKDRPTDNRDPSEDEINTYGKFLIEQIEVIEPEIIITLGRYSLDFIFKYLNINSEIKPISKIHGQIFTGQTKYGDVSVIAMYHPAFALYNGNNRQVILNDFQNIKSLLV